MSKGNTGDIDRFVAELQEQILEQARAGYAPAVVDHWQHPRNLGALERPDGYARITGSCGDSTEIFLRVVDGRVAEARFLTDGCGTTIASASMAVELATGRTLDDAMRLTDADILEALGGLPAESAHCALLAARALHAAVESYRR